MQKQSIVFVAVLSVCQLALVSANCFSVTEHKLNIECGCENDELLNLGKCHDQQHTDVWSMFWLGCRIPDDWEPFSKIINTSEIVFAAFYSCARKIRRNQYFECNDKFLKSFPKLKNLEIRFSRVNLTKDAFQNASTLTSLRLIDVMNHLREDSFLGAENLKDLDLKYGKLSYLEKNAFRGLGNLKTLNLFDNNLTKLLKGQLDGLHSLESLDLSRNYLELLEEGIFDDMKMLKRLNLNNNPRLNNLEPSLFQFNARLKVLKLVNIRLSNLSNGIFESTSELEKLDLRKNNLERLPDQLFKKLNNLKLLNLSENEFSVLSKSTLASLQSLKKLEKLRLSNNFIKKFPKEIIKGEIKSLKSLDLRFNNISGDLKVEHLIGSGNKKVMTINLESNLITSINFTDVQSVLMRRLKINLKNNPVSCDCQNYDLFRYLAGDLKFDKLEIDFGDSKCDGSRNDFDIEIKEFPLHRLKCV